MLFLAVRAPQTAAVVSAESVAARISIECTPMGESFVLFGTNIRSAPSKEAGATGAAALPLAGSAKNSGEIFFAEGDDWRAKAVKFGYFGNVGIDFRYCRNDNP
jgi:hypothetical protein